MALIPPSFLDSVVALGMQSQDKNIHFTGTGFMYGYPTGEVNDNGAPTYWTFLVTNRHVVAKASERGNTLHARFNRPVGARVPHLPADSQRARRLIILDDPRKSRYRGPAAQRR